jgi:hypothetical protein
MAALPSCVLWTYTTELGTRSAHLLVDNNLLKITLIALTDALAAGGDKAKRVFEAMMTMKKIDVAAIEAARRR